jgi:hypothetical protein
MAPLGAAHLASVTTMAAPLVVDAPGAAHLASVTTVAPPVVAVAYVTTVATPWLLLPWLLLQWLLFHGCCSRGIFVLIF